MQVEGADMGGGVDAAGEPGNDDESGGAEIRRQAFGEATPVEGGVAGADDGDRRFLQQMVVAVNRNQRRRVLDVGEQWRIGGLATGDK